MRAPSGALGTGEAGPTATNLRDLAERVGHASARMTLDVYGHAIANTDRKTAQAVAAILDEVTVEAKAPALRRRPQCSSFGT